MPTYVYQCPACGNRFERFQPINSKARAKCPVCGRTAKRAVTAAAGLIFRGPGFYATDYKSDAYKKEAEREKNLESPETGPEKTESRKTGGDD